MSTIPAPASTAEAVGMVLAGLGYLAAADPTALAAQAQAECLQAFERAGAIATAARARILAAFTAGHGYSADADYSPAQTTFAGAGVIAGDLTPECAAVVTAVLDALSAPMGAEWGWTVTLHPDGTTTARSPDGLFTQPP